MNKKFILLFVLSMITLVSIASAETLFSDASSYDNPQTAYVTGNSPITVNMPVLNVWWYINNVTLTMSTGGGFTESAFVEFYYVDGTLANSSVQTTTTTASKAFSNPTNSSLVKSIKIYWKSGSNGQSATISNIIGSGINGTNSLTVINVTIRNIADNSLVVTNTSVNYISTTNISNKVYTNVLTGYNNQRIGLLNDDYNVQVLNTNFVTTTLYPTISGPASYTYYLTNSGGTAKQIYVKNTYTEYLNGALVEILRQSDSAILYSAITDVSGEVQFNLTTDTVYSLRITLDGYVNKTVSYNAIDPSITITLESLITNNVSKYMGFSYSFDPIGVLVNNTYKNIVFTVNSNYFNMTSCNMTILNNASVVLNSTSVNFCNNRTGTKTLNVYPNNTGYVEVISTIVVNGEAFSYKNYYTVKNIYQGDFSLKSALESISNFNKGGFDSFGKGLFVMIVTIMILASAIRFSPVIFDRPESVLLLLTLISAIWSITGFLTLNISVLSSTDNQWFITILLSIGTFVAYTRNWSER